MMKREMRSHSRWVGAATGALVGGVAAAAFLRYATDRERRRLLRQGRIRALGTEWRTVNGLQMHARVATGGGAPGRVPVVLVHGMTVSGTYLMPTAERLAPDFDVYVPDLPGHGPSETPPEALDVPGLADALVAWMDAMGLERVSFLANSMGCQTVIDAAARYPERVDRLVLVGPCNGPDHRSILGLMWLSNFDPPYERPGLLALILRDALRMNVRIPAELFAMIDDPVESKLPLVRAPALLVRGEHDPVSPRVWVEEVSAGLGGAPVAVIRGWGHAVNHSAPDVLVEVAAPFLASSRPAQIAEWTTHAPSLQASR